GSTAVLEGALGIAVLGPAPPRGQQETWLQADPEDLHLRVSLSDSALLVISQPYAPGWTATVDGRAAPLLRADYAFDGLAVAAGTHDIVLRYLPAGLLPGLAGAAVAFALLAGSVLLSWRIANRDGRTP
ncbi:MAG TPA: YfhO family protein, partial [Chloroflexota bacterium]